MDFCIVLIFSATYLAMASLDRRAPLTSRSNTDSGMFQARLAAVSWSAMATLPVGTHLPSLSLLAAPARNAACSVATPKGSSRLLKMVSKGDS